MFTKGHFWPNLKNVLFFTFDFFPLLWLRHGSAEAASSPTPAFVINTVNGSDRVGRDVTSGHVICDVTSGHVVLTSLPVVQSQVPVPRAQPV